MIRWLFVSLLFCAASAVAQPYPSKPVRVVVPFPPGGAVDSTARLIATPLAATLGQPIVVENRAGAGGAIAEEFVARAAPDGYTLLYSVGSDMTTRKFLRSGASLDPLKDFTPIATAVGSVNCIAVGPSAPVNSLQELIEYARRNPGKLTYGSSGVASYHHLIGELLKHNGVDMLHVPYKGVAPSITGLVGGEIQVALTNLGAVQPQLKDGRVRLLAVLEGQRFPAAPDVPAVAEALPGFKAPLSWFGFFGPAELPQPLAVQLNGAIGKALQSPEVSAKLKAANLNAIVTPLAELRPFIGSAAQAFSDIVKTSGIKPTE